MWEIYPEILKELYLVEEYIKNNLHSRNKLLENAINNLLSAGGKRIRPAFVILAGKIGRYNGEKTILMAAALEILHMATLVHDDIIDNAKLRRGKVTVAEKYGVDMAVYTGDFLYTKAVLMLSKNLPIENLEYIAKSIKSICEGEVDQYQSKFNINSSIFSYLKRIGRKTAVLFAAACGLGANSAKCSKKQMKFLARFGFSYGMAFQIRDDLKDFLSTEQEEGKPILKDLKEGIYTLPIIYLCSKDAEFRKLIEKHSKSECSSLEEILEILQRADAINASKDLLNKYILRGINALDQLPDSIYIDILREQINLLKVP